MTLATWRGVTGHNTPAQGVKSICSPMFESVLNGFRAKRRISFFSHCLRMERSQNWPDLRSPISKFRDMRFIDTGTDINRWKFQGDRSFSVAMTNIKKSEVRSLDVTWWPDLEWAGSKIFTKCAETMYEQLCQKLRRSTLPFFSYLRKTWGVCVFKHPRPGVD